MKSFKTFETEIGYHDECKWHKIPCEKGPDCKHIPVNLCFNGDFFYATVNVPISTLDKNIFRKPLLTRIVSGIGADEITAVDSLINKLNTGNNAA